jgi:hypothetical protein
MWSDVGTRLGKVGPEAGMRAGREQIEVENGYRRKD